MLLYRVFAMRLIGRIVSLLMVLDEVEHVRPALFGVDDLSDQLSCLGRRQSR